MTGAAIRFVDNLAVVDFDAFGLESYNLFLASKSLPEHDLRFHEETQTYTLTTPARFAHMLGAEPPERWVGAGLDIAPHLWDYQRHGLAEALDAKRYAAFWDCGTGKTALELEYARQVAARTGGRVLILTLPDIVEEIRGMAGEWYGDALPVHRIRTRDELAHWCRHGEGVAITNHQKLIPGVMPEFRHLAGLVADESSILKSGGGVIKWNLIKSARGIEYKLSCTATPAPNDAMEYASQGSFLERLRTEGEIIWTYFSKRKDGEWYIKPHAKEAFYGFLASWSMYLRDPGLYGFRDNVHRVPEPEYHRHPVPATGEQLRLAERLGMLGAAGDLFGEQKGVGITEASIAAQAARGFAYGKRGAATTPVDSVRPQYTADLVRMGVARGRQVILWTAYNEESRVLAAHLRGLRVAHVSGATPRDERSALVRAFKAGDYDVLESKYSLLGFGQNLPNATVQVHSGFSDSYERLYQAIRRSKRYPQTEAVQVHFPYVPELEGPMLENVMDKAREFEADALEQQRFYAAGLRQIARRT